MNFFSGLVRRILTRSLTTILVYLSPRGYDEVSRAHLIDPVNTDPGRGVVWTHPAFANRRVYVRNDRELICVDLAEK